MRKRVYSLLTALALCLSMLPTAALAKGAGVVQNAANNESVYTISDDAELPDGEKGDSEEKDKDPVAEVIQPGKTEGTNYDSLPKALQDAQDGDTVKLLADHVTDDDDESTLAVVTKRLTLDLSDRTVDYLIVGDVTYDRYNEETGEYENISFTPGNLTVMSSSKDAATIGRINDLDFVRGTLDIQSGQIGYYENGPAGQLTCNENSGTVTISGGKVLGLTVGEGASVTVNGGTEHAGLWFNDGTLTITNGKFDSVFFQNNVGTIAISGGTFDSIANKNASTTIPPMLLLAKGYAFYNNEDTVQDGSRSDSLTNVTVKTHEHSFDENGKCACGVEKVVSDSNGNYYNTLQTALDAAVKDSTIEWIQPERNLTEQVTFNATGATVTLKMNGKTLTAPNNDAPAVAVSGGTLIFDDAATISQPTTADPYNQTITYAVSISGGKLIFKDKLTANGGVFNIPGNRTVQRPGVYANGGELDFQGDLDLKSGLTITGSAKLTQRLTKGTFRTDYMEGERLSVTGASNYKYLEDLLEDGYAFVDKDDHTVFRCVHSFTFWSGSNVTIVPHTHTWGPTNGDNYACTECDKACNHPDGYPEGKCPVCGKPCPHELADQSSVDHKYYCNDCKQQMFARIQTDTYSWSHFTNLKDAMAAAENGQTVLLLGDIDNSGKRAVVTGDGKTVTLDLNGHTVTDGWIQVGYGEDWNDQTSNTLKIIGRGSFITTGNLGVGCKSTLDLSGWSGENSTISSVNLSKGKEESNPESLLIVSENIGNIGVLGFYNWPSSGIKTKLTGGKYGELTITVQYNSERYSSMLAPGYAFRYTENNEYVEYTDTATNQGNTIRNVEVVKCDHGGTNGFDYDSDTCPYCGSPAVAQMPGCKFANLQDALDAQCEGKFGLNDQIVLLADADGDYTAEKGNVNLNLNGNNITGSLTFSDEVGVKFSGDMSGTVKKITFIGGKAGFRITTPLIGSLTVRDGATWSTILPNRDKDYVYGYKVNNSAWYDKDTLADYAGESDSVSNISVQYLPVSKVPVLSLNDTALPEASTVSVYQPLNFVVTSSVTNGYGGTGKLFIQKDGDTTPTEISTNGNYDKYTCNREPFELSQTGTYTVWATVSKDGYTRTSKKHTLTVEANLNNAIVELEKSEYTCQPLSDGTFEKVAPTIKSVTLFGKPVPSDAYSVGGNTTGENGGDYTLTITAKDNSGYTGTGSASWKILPYELSYSVECQPKVYDGTTVGDPQKVKKVDFFDTKTKSNEITLVKDTDYTIDSIEYKSANVGNNLGTERVEAEAKISLKGTAATNYKLTGGTAYGLITPAPFKDIKFNDYTYEVRYADTVPKSATLTYFGELDKLKYEICSDFVVGNNEILSNIELVDNSYFTFSAKENLGESDIGKSVTVKFKIYSKDHNYCSDELSFTVKIVDKEAPTLSLNPIEMTYNGMAVPASLISGAAKIGDHEIPGTLDWENGAPTNVADNGEYSVKFTPTYSTLYYGASAKANVTIKPRNIDDGDIALDCDTHSYEYNGAAKMPRVYGEYKYDQNKEACDLVENTDYTLTYPEDATNVGEKKITVTGRGNFGGMRELVYTITPCTATPTIVLSDTEYTYDGSNKTPKATVTVNGKELTEGKDFEVAYVNNKNVADGAKAIITAKGNYSFATVEIPFNISKANSVIDTAPAANDVIYDAALHALITEGKATGGTFEYKLDGGEWTTDVPTAKDAGEYTVWYRVIGDRNHNDIDEQQIIVTVAKAAAPAVTEGALTIINNVNDTYNFDLSTLLPKLTSPLEYGTISYGRPVTELGVGTFVTRIDGTTGELTLEVSNRSDNTTGAIGTIIVPVTTDNYEDITLIINVDAKNRSTSHSGGGITRYTVSFETNGGSKISSERVKRNSTLTEPITPIKEGFDFAGWYTDKELTTKYDFSAKVTKSLMLYAAWTQKDNSENQIILTISEKSAQVFGTTKTNDVAPKIVNDRTMLPARFVAENLGAEVLWDGDKELVTIKGKNLKTGENITILIYIGSDIAYVNGREIKLDSAAFVENDRTYTPVRFISEELGASVDWSEQDMRVVITLFD